MSATFDIFQLDHEGVRWLESAESLEHAKSRIEQLAMRIPGEFLLLDQTTGTKLVIKHHGPSAAESC